MTRLVLVPGLLARLVTWLVLVARVLTRLVARRTAADGARGERGLPAIA